MRITLAVTLMLGTWALVRADDPGAPSPHDGQHLVVLRPANFGTENGGKVVLVADRGTGFDGQAVKLTEPVLAPGRIRHPGKYTLWVRVGIAKGERGPVDVQLSQGTRTVLRATVADGPGSEERGGPAGYQAFAKKASQSGTFKDVTLTPNKNPGVLGDDLEKELLGKTADEWFHALRLEQPFDQRPFYWWKVGTAELAAGEVRLRVEPAGKVKADAVFFDGAFLTTAEKPAYPFNGDVNAPKASYVRFRIDQVPTGGLTVSAGLRIHADPWATPRVWLNPEKLNSVKAEPHTKTGYTRWYRLQEIDRTPAFGPTEAQLNLEIKPAGAVGATQFAVQPHADFVLREIRWDEPEGLHISMAMDFETHLHRLRTLRDHAREHYDKALAATGDRLFPLTRGDLYFTNSWGGATGDCADYMNKTLRLLGFNSAGVAQDPIANRDRYGWTSTAGHYWPPAYLPYDEAASVKQYDDYYRQYFAGKDDLYRGVTTFQIADEPGEISRGEMTAPLWRFGKDDKGEKWDDAAGGSDLNTRRVDLHDCVLEGKIEKHGSWIGFRVGLDDPGEPKKFAYWHIGRVSSSLEHNLATGRDGKTTALLVRAGAAVLPTGTPFKVVYHGTQAALYLNNRLIHQHADLPTKGGLGLTGAAKTIRELRLRPLRKDEMLAGAVTEKPKNAGDDLLDELTGATKEPDWAKVKPLEKGVAEDWTPAGGLAQAHAGFRKWAASRGLSPRFFGQKDWADVRMLTVPTLVRTPEEARLFYWSREYSGYLTPRMFNLAAEAIHKHAPNKSMRGFVALSGHALYFPSSQPLDMFQLAQGPAMMPGISDWMSLGSWFWDSHQAVAFSIAPYRAGARRDSLVTVEEDATGLGTAAPLNYPMMHCVYPSAYRSYTMLANNVRLVSYFNFGPSYAVTEGYWSEADACYDAVHRTNNRAALVDDVLASATLRPSRVAMLYSTANEHWNPQSSFADKRASFLALSHEYYQPELVTEAQVRDGALERFDALYVLDPIVQAKVQAEIEQWVRAGGLLWACADALTKNEYNEPLDLLAKAVKLERSGIADKEGTVTAASGQADFRSHTVVANGRPATIKSVDGRVRATYDDAAPAWVEWPLDKGKVVYVGHRVGLTYTSKKVRSAGYHTIWADTGRALLTTPLHEAKVERDLILSQPVVMAGALSAKTGTVVVLYNMQPTPRKELQISLKEPVRPQSVEVFAGDKLTAVPFEYRDGRVVLTLPELAEEQMILVRRTPPPADPRAEAMRQRTEKQLASDDPLTVAAGAWFVGFFPDWKLADRLVPLLTHPRWEVRRAAAEALGRLGAGTEALAAAVEKEKDSHVLGDELAALARLDAPAFAALGPKFAGHSDAWVRRQAVTGLEVWASGKPAERSVAAKSVATAAIHDPDLRVRRAGIALLSRTAPSVAVETAATAEGVERPFWSQAIADNDATFTEYVQRGLPGGDELLLAVAGRRADPALAAALVARLDRVVNEPSFVTAALRQRDPMLAKKLFARRDELAKGLAAHLTLILENTFEARLGNVLADWESYLK